MEDWIETHRLNQDSLDLINSEVESAINEHDLKNDKDGKSTSGENGLQYELRPFINQFTFIENLTKIAEKTVREKGLITDNQTLEVCSLWSVIGGKGTYHRIHRHNKLGIDHYSMVVYTHVDQTQDELSGCFYAVLNDGEENDFIEFSPEQGDVLMFPVWVCHGTYPQTTEKRQTLNLDFFTKDI